MWLCPHVSSINCSLLVVISLLLDSKGVRCAGLLAQPEGQGGLISDNLVTTTLSKYLKASTRPPSVLKTKALDLMRGKSQTISPLQPLRGRSHTWGMLSANAIWCPRGAL